MINNALSSPRKIFFLFLKEIAQMIAEFSFSILYSKFYDILQHWISFTKDSTMEPKKNKKKHFFFETHETK